MKTCRNCGKELKTDYNSGRPLHEYGRWEGDNGLYCYKDKDLTGDTRTDEKAEFVDKFGFNLRYGEEGKIWAENQKDKERVEINSKTGLPKIGYEKWKKKTGRT